MTRRALWHGSRSSAMLRSTAQRARDMSSLGRARDSLMPSCARAGRREWKPRILPMPHNPLAGPLTLHTDPLRLPASTRRSTAWAHMTYGRPSSAENTQTGCSSPHRICRCVASITGAFSCVPHCKDASNDQACLHPAAIGRRRGVPRV